MIFELKYLGSVQHSFSLNFSRPAAPIIAQYFSLLHLGREGYTGVVKEDMKNARLLSRALERMGRKKEAEDGWWEVISGIHRAAGTYEGLGIDSDDIQVRTLSEWTLVSESKTTLHASRHMKQAFLSSPSSSPMLSRKSIQISSSIRFMSCFVPRDGE